MQLKTDALKLDFDLLLVIPLIIVTMLFTNEFFSLSRYEGYLTEMYRSLLSIINKVKKSEYYSKMNRNNRKTRLKIYLFNL